MWETRRLTRATAQPRGVARPWTPPDTDADPDATSHEDYFSDAYRRLNVDYLPTAQDRWSHDSEEGTRCDTPTEDQPHQQHRLRPKPISAATAPTPAPEPSTPTHSPLYPLHYGAANTCSLPRYPYTPDSSRMLRRNTERTPSPVPWDTYSSHSSSPVQNALSSCIAHFENLLQTRQPDEDQMEYIVGQFEAMATYLSAPDAQSRGTDEHLFNELENGLVITQARGQIIQELNQEYIAQVGHYIQSVRRYAVDLKTRMEEVKMLNSIQLDVIQDLRSQMESVNGSMHSSPRIGGGMDGANEDMQDDEHSQPFGSESTATLVNSSLPSSQILDMSVSSLKSKSHDRHVSFDTSPTSTPRRRIITIIHKPQQRSFWSSFAEALDSFGDMILES